MSKGVIGNNARLFLRKHDEYVPSHQEEGNSSLSILLYGTAQIYFFGIHFRILKEIAYFSYLYFVYIIISIEYKPCGPDYAHLILTIRLLVRSNYRLILQIMKLSPREVTCNPSYS